MDRRFRLGLDGRRLAAPVLGLALLGSASPALQGQSTPARGLRQKQAIPTDGLGILRPGRLAYSAEARRFIVLPALEGGTRPPGAGVASVMDPYGKPAGTIVSAALSNAQAIAYDAHWHRLLALDVATGSLHAIPGDAAGRFDVARTARLRAPGVELLRPAGMAVDPANGDVFVLDHATRRILRLSPPGTEAGPGATIPPGQWIGLGAIGPLELRGLAFDPSSRHLLTLEASGRTLHELATDGQLVASHDVSAKALADPRSLVLGPSGDQTDDPATLSLFVADPGAATHRRGHVVELAWVSDEEIPTAPISISASLVRVTATSAFSPPSPDPSGISYDSVHGRLVISDAEVEEMSIWRGKNIFETSLSGTLLRSYDVTSFTTEPVGAAFNANTLGIFFSDDDAYEVFVVKPGPDGLIGTGDDTHTSFGTRDFGSNDPEGIGYDRVNDRLFIADGVNQEIYVLRPGPDGVFDGAPPTGDDQVTHFDTGSLGVTDPETVEYKEDTGTLLLIGSTGSQIVKEVTTAGALVAQIDLSFAPLDKPAGMAWAPTSNNPAGRSLYIVNRRVDNDSDPSENDGTLVEVALGSTGTNTPPAVSAGPNQTITLPASAVLDGTVSDDGLPNPPGAVTTTWGVVSGPGPVTFQGANAVDTQASFTTPGTYVLSLTANDSQLSATDEVQIVVNSDGTLERRIATGSDDAEESATGTMYMTSTDLELVFDVTNQTVGLRFPSVTIDQGATIATAYVQFEADEAQSEATSLVIQGEAADHAGTFTSTAGNISTRERTSASVSWTPAAWEAVGEAGANQRTPELKTVIQEIVSRAGWVSGNALAIIITGSGHRTARAYEGGSAGAALLHIEVGGTKTAAASEPRPNFSLHAVSASPARGMLRVDFGLEQGPASLELLDVAGRRIELHDVGALGPGRHQQELGEALPAGVYFVRLRQRNHAQVMKAALLR